MLRDGRGHEDQGGQDSSRLLSIGPIAFRLTLRVPEFQVYTYTALTDLEHAITSMVDLAMKSNFPPQCKYR